MKEVIIISETPENGAKTERTRGTTNTMDGNRSRISRNEIIKNKIPFIIGNAIGGAVIKCNIIRVNIKVNEGRGKDIQSSRGKSHDTKLSEGGSRER
jgi:hypothetical protein